MHRVVARTEDFRESSGCRHGKCKGGRKQWIPPSRSTQCLAPPLLRPRQHQNCMGRSLRSSSPPAQALARGFQSPTTSAAGTVEELCLPILAPDWPRFSMACQIIGACRCSWAGEFFGSGGWVTSTFSQASTMPLKVSRALWETQWPARTAWTSQ